MGVRVLERIAARVEAELTRAGQLLAYYGGDEFFALMPETHPGGAAATAEAMRAGVEAMGIPGAGRVTLTISLGAATAFPYRLVSPEALIVAFSGIALTPKHDKRSSVSD